MATRLEARRRGVLIAAGIFTALIVGGALLDALFAEPLLRAVSGTALGALISEFTEPLQGVSGVERLRDDVLFALWVLACTFLFLLALAGLYHQQVGRFVKQFFTAKAHPLTLALFRIVLFTFAIFVFQRDYYLLFSELPEVFLNPPVGAAWILSIFPVTPDLVTWMYTLFICSSLLAALGAYTRVSSVAALLLGLYVLGIPNYFGKIDHYNHLVWFMAIMAVSPCADTLSVDAFRRARREPTWTPQASQAYALPIRFIWLLMGVCYFFPGLYKLATGGFAWILGDNFRYIMFRNWVSLGEYIPVLRLDASPLLYRGSAAVAVAFEFAFMLLIFSPRLRPFVALLGFSFHGVTNLVMRIPFYSLQMAYLTFVDWHSVFTWLGQRLYPQKARLVYGEHTSLGRTLSALPTLDLFERVTYTPTQSVEQAPYLEIGNTRRTGLDALRGLCARILILWPLLPFLRLLPEGIWPRPSDKLLDPKPVARAAQRTNVSLIPIAAVGIFLVSINLAFGFLRIQQGWPFALYPVFSGIAGPTAESMQVAKVDASGEEIINLQPLIDEYGYGKLQAILKAAAAQGPEQRKRLEALSSLLALKLNALEPSDEVRLYAATYRVDPAYWAQNPTKRELLAKLPPGKSVLQTGNEE